MMTVYNCMLASSELEVSFFYTFQIAKCIGGAVCCCFLQELHCNVFAITIFGVVIEKHLDWLLCE